MIEVLGSQSSVSTLSIIWREQGEMLKCKLYVCTWRNETHALFRLSGTLYASRIIEIRYSHEGSRKNVLGTWDIRNIPRIHIL